MNMDGLETIGDEDSGVVGRESQAITEAAKTRIQTAYFMAFKNQRNEDQALERMIKVCKRPKFAAGAMYDKCVGRDKRGNDIIKSGLSIRFAEMAIREFRNIYVDQETVFEDVKRRLVKVLCCDLETNTTFTATLTIDKTVERESKKIGSRQIISERANVRGEIVYLVESTEQELYNKENAAISKAIRNQGLRLIPQYIIEEAIDAINETLEGMDKAEFKVDKMILSYSEQGVTEVEITKWIGKAVADFDKRDIVKLRRLYQAIVEGFATWKQATGGGTEQAGGNGDKKSADDVINEKLGGDPDQEKEELEIVELWKVANKEVEKAKKYLNIGPGYIEELCGLDSIDVSSVSGMTELAKRLKERITEKQIKDIEKYWAQTQREDGGSVFVYIQATYGVDNYAFLTKSQGQKIIDYFIGLMKTNS